LVVQSKIKIFIYIALYGFYCAPLKWVEKSLQQLWPRLDLTILFIKIFI